MLNSEFGTKSDAIAAVFSNSAFRNPNLLSFLDPHVLASPPPLLLHDRIDDVRDEGIDTREVADDVQVNVARFDRLAVALAKPVEVGLDEFVFHGAHLFLVPQNTLGKIAVVAREG